MNIIKVGKSSLIGGLEWFPIDSLETSLSEVNEIIKRRKNSIEESPLGKRYAVCSTSQGTCAAGIILLKDAKKVPSRAISLAARCAQYALGQKAPDAIFGWRSGNEINLIGIRNGLPIYDAVISPENFEAEFSVLLAIFETGCTTFGDPSLFMPPVVEVPLSVMAELKGQGELKKAGTPLWIKLLILVSLAFIGYGYWVWETNEEQRRMLEELAAQASQMTDPVQIFAKTQTEGLSAIKGCQDINGLAGKILGLHYLVRGYRLSSIKANCETGVIMTLYKSPYPADLSVRKEDSRIKLTEKLNEAIIEDSFVVEPIRFSEGDLLPWQEWLVATGVHKQRVEKIGVEISFNSPSFAFGEPPEGSNIPVVVKGEIKVSGPAQYMVDVMKLIRDVAWQEIVISEDNNGFISFGAKGSYYAIKD